jgi:hypothetical protein
VTAAPKSWAAPLDPPGGGDGERGRLLAEVNARLAASAAGRPGRVPAGPRGDASGNVDWLRLIRRRL